MRVRVRTWMRVRVRMGAPLRTRALSFSSFSPPITLNPISVHTLFCPMVNESLCCGLDSPVVAAHHATVQAASQGITESALALALASIHSAWVARKQASKVLDSRVCVRLCARAHAL